MPGLPGTRSRRGRGGGLLVADHGHLRDRFVVEMSGRLRSSEVRFDETVVEGLENASEAFLGLQRGENSARCWSGSDRVVAG